MTERSFSLRGRLVGMMAVLFIGGTGVLYVAARMYGQAAADRSYDRLLTGSALSIVETLSITDGAIQVDIPYAALDMLSSAPEDRVFYRVFGPREQTVTGYDDLPNLRKLKRDGDAALEETHYFDAEYRGELVRFALLGREIAEPGLNGRIWVQVGQTRRAREALAKETVVNALLPIGTMTILALALVWFGIARALRPLERIGQDLAHREPSDLAPVAAPVPDEIVPLVSAIDGFMYRLKTNMETLRAFIAEAAHQMRTPLAALRAQAQLGLEEKDPDELRRSLRAVERNAAKLSRLLNQLLSDATVIHRSDLRHFETFDLLKVVRKAMSESVPVSGQSEVNFHTSIKEAPYAGDALMLGEALKNLIDNAIRHGDSEHGGVTVELRDEDGCYLLSVSDHGPGIPAEDRERVFERFSRGRSNAPGVGLGLAIVRKVVEIQHGEVVLLDRESGGLTVQIRLPREE